VAEAWTSHEALHAKLPEFDKAYHDLVQPGTALDEQIAKAGAAQKAYQTALAKLQQDRADSAAFQATAARDLDDSLWGDIKLPSAWNAKNVGGPMGMVWYRKTIDLPSSWAGMDLTLNLGQISAGDIAYFNGQAVGQTGWDKGYSQTKARVNRAYHVPGKLVKAGRNVVALCVINLQGTGGWHSRDAKAMFVAPATSKDSDTAKHISLAGTWKFKAGQMLPWRPRSPISPNRPSILYNGMIHPMIPYAIRGAIWYQGEANASRAAQYRTLLPTMITDWRQQWGQGDFPFLIVQLPNFHARTPVPTDDAWAQMRYAQQLASQAVPNAGLAVTIDVGEAGTIHPPHKQPVGQRLALIALKNTYHQDVVDSGPVFKSFAVKDGKAVVNFDHVDDGLVAQGQGQSAEHLDGFAVAGPDGKYFPANARIEGATIVLQASQVTEPAAVCYAWGTNPPATLFNKAGLPARPFKTDEK
jgi:sialate O-acetylesterase